MSKNLVVVESPAKARTIKKYLGPEYEVLASYGHVRDLVPKEGAVDPANRFAMKYRVIEKNEKHVSAIAKALRGAEALYLATDPDREGEAISWHLVELLREKRLLGKRQVYRVVFHEITRKAIQEAVDHPRQLSQELIDAQQARRALDYLVGFNLSPLLWKKIRRGLSAGRVQSPALRMIVEREEEIERFVQREYWTIEGECSHQQQPFPARLVHYNGEKLRQFDLGDAEAAQQAHDRVVAAASGWLDVVEVQKKQRRRNPAAPFITSTLQQEAARKLRFSAQKTMRTAQQLYEGIDIGEGNVGLISYMRTDSVNLAQEALAEIRGLIASRYGDDKVPRQPRHFKTSAKNAQEAHEAIRPTSVERTPESLTRYLSSDQLRLYELIWKRTVACQMTHATINTVTVDLAAGAERLHLLRASGSTIVDPGFMSVYQEGKDDSKGDDDEGRILPPMSEGERVALTALKPEQHFTEPPPRYSEASLVKALEEYGIGRPSTYASIISTLMQREYVIQEKRRFKPTDVGRIVGRFLTDHFTQYVDYGFTARLEDQLDAVSRGEESWVPLMESFWTPFRQLIDHKEASVSRSDVTQEQIDEKCPKCSAPLAIRLGKRGRFIGCTTYPECDYTRNLDETAEQSLEPEVVEGRSCPKCGSSLVVKSGRYGKFIGCSGYPACRHIEPLEKPEATGVRCPSCGKGELLKRKSRNGKIFYSCATYPACDYAVWNPPVAEVCPGCSWPILTIKTTKRRGTEKVCPQRGCNHAEPVVGEEVEA